MNTSFGPEAGAWTVALLGAGVGSMFSGATTLVDGNRARRNDVEAPGSSGNPGGSGNSDKDVHINAIPLFAEALLGAVVIATAVAGSAQPTGSDLLDPMYRGLFACLVLVGFRLSTHRVRIAFVGLLAAACLVASWPTASVISVLFATFVVAALAAGWKRQMSSIPALASMLGGLAALLAQNLPAGSDSRLANPVASTVLLTVGSLVLLISLIHWLAAKVPGRGVRVASGVVVGAGVLAAGALGIYALGIGRSVQNDLREGASFATVGINQAQALDRETATASFEQALLRVKRVEARLASPLFRAVRLLPAAAQNLRASEIVTKSTEKVVEEALRVLKTVDIGKLRLPDGSLDLRILETLDADLGRARSEVTTSLGTARAVDTTWLVPGVRSRLDQITERLEKAQPLLTSAEEASRFFPALLGASTPRTYLLLASTPSETRGAGGLIGNWGELTVSNGQLKLERFDRIIKLIDGGTPWHQRTYSGPPGFLERYREFTPMRYFQNLLASPDFPTDAAIVADQYPQAGGRPVDGVISIDPFGFAALLALTGPINVEGVNGPITNANAAQILLFDLYKVAGNAQEGRIDALERIFQTAFSQLRTIPLSDPARIGSVFSQPIKDRRIQMWVRDPELQAYVKKIGLSGTYVSEPADVRFGFINQNAGGNKIDWFLHRSVTYEATVESGQPVNSTVTLRLQNEAPASGLPDYIIGNLVPERGLAKGTNSTIVSFYASGELVDVKADGVAVSAKSEKEFGLNVYSLVVTVPAGGETSLRYSVHEKSPGTSRSYTVQVLSQPMVNNDQLAVRMSVPKRWGLVANPKTRGAIEGAIPASEIQSQVQRDNLRLTEGRFETTFPLTATTSWVFASR